MKIKFSDLELNPNGESPKEIRAEIKKESQIEYPIDSPSAKIFDRSNRRTSVTFLLEHSHKNEVAAMEFSIAHPNSIAELSPAKLDFLDDKDEIIVTLENTIVSKIKSELNGVITTTRYEFLTQTQESTL